ncbi:MAG: 50S ribosomal protein L9, partial [Candidatus Magasanikbacteria bacterium]|nr:50S ribosomal protein L9 [Candidatus Magasanikbacteria bacterium]
MRVLLLQDIPNFGKKGDIKEAADGYARNFLLSRKKALPATAENIRILKEEAERIRRAEELELKSIEEKADELKGVSLEFEEKADAEGKLFGGISSAHLMAALRKRGFVLEKRQIDLAGSLKKTGKYFIKIQLGRGRETEITVNIAS